MGMDYYVILEKLRIFVPDISKKINYEHRISNHTGI